MGLNYDCIVTVYAKVPHKSIKNPRQWLGDLVFNAIRKYDALVERKSLIIDEKISEDTEGRLIDSLHLECENFQLATDCDEDGDKILAKIVRTMTRCLNKKGASGSVNVYGYQNDRPPEISSCNFLSGSKNETIESVGFRQAV